ncbi:hypothetical protein OPV22_004802 [Ensete ventricosum]|uniref:SBP-type domain-containing protein n=1 Tax=Ensete ventricosum TaxID=4639 RepID=A0AAV8RH18_ENSVE|nr:hypothetical protein OPV22_004802 [Ensete ventricosum]
MEARIGSKSHQFLAAGTSNVNVIGQKGVEWDLNDWRWDGEHFVATPLDAVPADCWSKHLRQDAAKGLVLNSPSSSSEGADCGLVEKDNGDSEKKRRIVVVEEDESCGVAGSLSLRLGGHAYPVVESDLANWEGKNEKKNKSQGGSSSHPTCQVEGCDADLSDSRDYHRRHKVCEMHAKASSAMVRNAIQRFCQQCSRFHLLEEFDEGKRSCRRRLAGHNRRRRKTHPDDNVNGSSSLDERASSYLLISLLRILSNLQSNNTERSQDQELLTHFLAQDLPKLVTTAGTSSEAIITSVPNGVLEQDSRSPLGSAAKMTCTPGVQGPPQETDHIPSVADVPKIGRESSDELVIDRVGMKDFDLNSDPRDCKKGEMPATSLCTGIGSPCIPSWLLQNTRQSSPPQTSGNSDSTSNYTQSRSHGDAQCRTDRIIFKLFGKNPHDLPLVLRAQILDWLSNSPTDIESYIRPGCIILTIYLRQPEFAWAQLCNDLSSYLARLLHKSHDFWTTGWIFARVQNHAAFIYDGQVVLDMPLLVGHPNHCKILSVTPIAVSYSTNVNFTVKGFNLVQPTSRLLCSFDGKYLFQETTQDLVEGFGRGAVYESAQCLSFSCLLPDKTGRGFIELEDCGLSNGFFPFIVADEDVCSEIRVLEKSINVASCDDQLQERKDTDNSRNQALDFINELGWLLRRNHMVSISRESKFSPNLFPLPRFRWLMSFAMNREWAAVVKKLLDILFSGTVDAGGQSSMELALSENLLHSAVQINSKAMVELLLRYKPSQPSKQMDPDQFLFRPDMLGPSGLTPLHIASSTSGAESILDALTNDPGQLGINAWKNVVLNISGDASYKPVDVLKSVKADASDRKTWLSTKQPPSCNRCSQQLAYQNSVARTMLYRPVMLSLVGIAAVCVCVGLLFKTPPQVFYVFPSFRWELLEYGFM